MILYACLIIWKYWSSWILILKNEKRLIWKWWEREHESAIMREWKIDREREKKYWEIALLMSWSLV